MKKLLMVAAVALPLGGCVTGRDGNIVVGDYVVAVQQTAVSLCGFLPTAQFIGDLFLQGETYDTVSTVASAICRAVSARSYRPGTVPTVKGVPVQGRFLR
jgi:hypothetical protein